MNKNNLIVRGFACVFLLITNTSYMLGQLGGERTYSFLNLAVSAKDAALGGKLVSDNSLDITLANNNPALLNKLNSNQLAMTYMNYFSDISYGYGVYSLKTTKIGQFSGSMQYINYGKFNETNTYGLKTGNFYAADYAISISYSLNIDSSFTFGASIKPLYSAYEKYNSFGIAFDIGGLYQHPNRLFSAGISFRNIGGQIKSYAGTRENIPFEITAGASKKLKHAPFQFHFTFHQLQRYRLNNYKEQTNNQPESLEKKESSNFNDEVDNIFRHFNLGIEFLPFKNFSFRLGYNHQRRKEMTISEKPGTVGFSWGVGLKLHRFHISYGRSVFHLAGASNIFTITADFNQ